MTSLILVCDIITACVITPPPPPPPHNVLLVIYEWCQADIHGRVSAICDTCDYGTDSTARITAHIVTNHGLNHSFDIDKLWQLGKTNQQFDCRMFVCL